MLAPTDTLQRSAASNFPFVYLGLLELAPTTKMDATSSLHIGTTSNPSMSSFSEADIDRICATPAGDPSFLTAPSALNIQRNYDATSKKQVTIELHYVTLREYYKHKRIPRGMRSSLQPTLFSQDIEFRARFENLSNKYASDLILLNLEFLQKELASISDKMPTIDSQLKVQLTEEDYQQFITKQTTFLNKFRMELTGH